MSPQRESGSSLGSFDLYPFIFNGFENPLSLKHIDPNPKIRNECKTNSLKSWTIIIPTLDPYSEFATRSFEKDIILVIC